MSLHFKEVDTRLSCKVYRFKTGAKIPFISAIDREEQNRQKRLASGEKGQWTNGIKKGKGVEHKNRKLLCSSFSINSSVITKQPQLRKPSSYWVVVYYCLTDKPQTYRFIKEELHFSWLDIFKLFLCITLVVLFP